MIGIVMNVRTKHGRADEFARLVAKLQADVRRNEPGATIWQVLRADDDPALFTFVELFVDEAAFAAHPDMPYHKAMSAAGWDCVEGEPEIRRYTPLADADFGGAAA
jgi:quinol monooxygenase YgiN